MRWLALALLAMLAVAAGCTTWSKTGMPAHADAAQDLPSMIRVHLTDGRRLTLEHANIVGDSLVGDLREPSRRGHESAEKRRVAVALADIESVDKNRFNVVLTLLTLTFLVGLTVSLLALGAQNETF